jgi:hypothetical protein
MKVGDLIVGALFGLAIGLCAHSCMVSLGSGEVEVRCDATEEMRLKIALTECSDIVFTRAWQDDGSKEEN